jgi:hypothetical protein
MKTKLMITMASATLLAAIAMPAFAAPTAMDDNALDAIQGKGTNSDTITGVSTVSVLTGDSTNGSVQVGYYQWDDIHTGDLSHNKGGNDASGNNSQVQQNVGALLNILGWGAAAQVSMTNTGNIGGGQDNESWGTLYVGGF